MEIYYAPLVLTLAALTAQVARNRQIDLGTLACCAFAVASIAGLRWYADVDYAGYVDLYDDTPPLGRFNATSIAGLYGEPSYLFITSIFRALGLEFFVLALAISTLSILLKTFVVSRMSTNASLAVALYLCLHFVTIEFIQMRWAIATGFISLAFYLQYRHKPIPSLVSFALAVCFHYYSLVFVGAALIIRMNGYRRFQVLFALVAAGALLLPFDRLAPFLVTDSDLYLLTRLARYAGDEFSTVGLFSYAKAFMYPTIYLLCVWYRPAYPWQDDPRNVFLLKVTLVSLSITLALSFIPIMHHRATVVADIFGILWVLNAIQIAFAAGLRVFAWTGLVLLFSAWHVMDVRNYLAAQRLYEYQTWTNEL